MTDHITPQEAQDLLDGATEGPWKAWGIMRHPGTPTYILGKDREPVAGSPHTDEGGIATHNRDLIVAAPRLAATIAADTIEYGVEFTDKRGNKMYEPIYGDSYQWGTYDQAKAAYELVHAEPGPFAEGGTVQIVARRVSPTWEVKE